MWDTNLLLGVRLIAGTLSQIRNHIRIADFGPYTKADQSNKRQKSSNWVASPFSDNTRHSNQAERWVGSGLVVAEKQFRRIDG